MVDGPAPSLAGDGAVFVPIEEKHGPDCTCAAVGHIAIDLVAASRRCPGDRNPHRAGTIAAQLEQHQPPTYPGSITITWPSTDPHGHNTVVHDAETGQLLPVNALRIVLDANNTRDFRAPLHADARILVDTDGTPQSGPTVIPVPDPDNPAQWYARTFRCRIAEIRTLPAPDTNPEEQP